MRGLRIYTNYYISYHSRRGMKLLLGYATKNTKWDECETGGVSLSACARVRTHTHISVHHHHTTTKNRVASVVAGKLGTDDSFVLFLHSTCSQLFWIGRGRVYVMLSTFSFFAPSLSHSWRRCVTHLPRFLHESNFKWKCSIFHFCLLIKCSLNIRFWNIFSLKFFFRLHIENEDNRTEWRRLGRGPKGKKTHVLCSLFRLTVYIHPHLLAVSLPLFHGCNALDFAFLLFCLIREEGVQNTFYFHFFFNCFFRSVYS